MIGHTLGAAGAIESIACVLMLTGGFVHPSINCEDVHPEIEEHADSIPHTVLEKPDLDVRREGRLRLRRRERVPRVPPLARRD